MRRPIVAVVLHGGSLAIEPLLGANAIIDAHYPGQAGARAIVDALLGRANRWGRLSATLYPANFTTARNMTSMGLRAGPGATYWWYTTPLFAFGAGETYTRFTYEWSAAEWAAAAGGATRSLRAADVLEEAVSFSCTVKNTGGREGDAVVLGFVSAVDPDFPAKRLFDFLRVSLAAGETKVVMLAAPAEAFAMGDEDGLLSVHPGPYWVQVGDINAPASKQVELTGEVAVLEDYRDYFAQQGAAAETNL